MVTAAVTEFPGEIYAQVDSLAVREDATVVAATSRVFGNQWDGGVTAFFGGGQKSCHMPCGTTDVAFTGAEKQTFALACDDGNIVVIALTSVGQDGWKPLHLLAEHDDCVTGLSCPSYAPDTLASSSADHTCRLWAFRDGGVECTRTLEGHHAPVWATSHGPDGVLATAGQDGSLRLWDTRQGLKGEAQVARTRSPLFCVAWLGGNQVVAGGEEGVLGVYDTRAMGGPSTVLGGEGHQDSVRRVCVGKDKAGGAALASAGDDGRVAVRSCAALDKDVAVVKPHTDYARGLCAGDGYFLSGGWDKVIKRVEAA